MNFDLDIHNYSKRDLEDLLDLKYPYASEDVTTKCTVFQESVVNNSTLDSNFTSKISTFLDNVKIKLISNPTSDDELLSHRNFENPKLPNSKVLQVGNTQIIEQNLRDSNKASNPSSTALTSSLSYNLAADEAPGKMNPLYKRTLNKCLNIDSRFRENYYSTNSSDFLISLPMKFSNVIQLQLSEIELPLTFYAISKSLKNNYFWLRIIVNDLNKHFFNYNLWKFGQYSSTGWDNVDLNTPQVLNNTINSENIMGYTIIEIPDGNYIHSDMVKFLNEKLASLFLNKHGATNAENGEYAQLIKFVIDINNGGSGSGKTIVSSTTYSFKNPITGTGGLSDANLIQLGNDPNKYGIPASSTLFELNWSALHIDIKPGSTEWIDLPFTHVQDIYNERSTQPLPLSFGWILGFRHPLYTSYDKLTKSPVDWSKSNTNEDLMKYPGCSYVSEGFFECHGPRYLFLVVDDFNNNVNTNMFSAFNSSILSKNILARISIKGTVFSILSDDSKHITSTIREYFGPVNIEKMRIQLLDEYGRILEMNNMDFSMALNIKSVYDS